MAASRVVSRLQPFNSVLLVCDMQEKFRESIKYFPQISTVAKRLIDTAQILNVKIIATEQYPKGLGHTITELGIKDRIPIFEKTRFSMCTPDVSKEIDDSVKSLIVCGIEAHVCVLHTVLDFIERGYDVHVVADATSSRTNPDRRFAFKQMERAGAVLTTSECVILGLLQDASHSKFREVQKIIRESAPDTGLDTFV